MKKHLKRLRKEEGAIKLVGGANEYEGEGGQLMVKLYLY